MDKLEKEDLKNKFSDMIIEADGGDSQRERRVATNLRHMRQSREMTPEELAEEADVEEEYVHYLEEGERGVSVNLLFQLAAALNVDVRELFQPLQSEQNG